MAELDIRDGTEKCVIDTIRFAERDVICYDYDNSAVLEIACDHNERGSEYTQRIWIKDIPHLIKALQKAQELWGNT